MADINDVLAANRAAVIELVEATAISAANWTTPRAPGKWSPSQVVEHVAGSLEEGASIVSGAPSKLRTPPFFLRPLVRLFIKRTLKKGVFPNGFKADKSLDPATGPATPAQARVRLELAHVRFDEECRRRVAGGHDAVAAHYAIVSLEDFIRFNTLHTRHHSKQMP